MATAKRRRRHRRYLLPIMAVLVVGAAIAALGSWWLRPARRPLPPRVDLTGVDPAVCRAVEAARTAVLQSPDSAEAWGKLGMVLKSHGLPVSDTNACLAQAERLDPRQPRWPYLQAIAVITTDPEAAIAKLQRAVELCDCDPDAPRLQLGEVLLDQGRFEEAAEHFLRVLQKDPGNARASLGLAQFAYGRGELSESMAHLDHCVADVHTRKAANQLRAQIHERLGNPSAAAHALRQAADLPPDRVWPDRFQEEVDQMQVGKEKLLARAHNLNEWHSYQDALRLLPRLVGEYPDSALAWVEFGRSYLGMKNWPAAEQALRKATELGPDVPTAHFYLGVALFFQKKYPAAVSSYRKAIELKPDYALAHYNLGHALREQGDEAGAMAEFRASINCTPNYGPAHFNLAALLLKRGQRDEAQVHARHAVRLNPTDPKAKELLEQVTKQAAEPR